MDRRQMMDSLGRMGILSCLGVGTAPTVRYGPETVAPVPANLDESVRAAYEGDFLDAVDLTRHLRTLWAGEAPGVPVMAAAEFRRLLAAGRLNRDRLVRLMTPRYLIDLYEPGLGDLVELGPNGTASTSFRSFPLNRVVVGGSPPERVAATLRAMARDLAREVSQEAKRAGDHVVVLPEAYVTRNGPTFETYACLHLVYGS